LGVLCLCREEEEEEEEKSMKERERETGETPLPKIGVIEKNYIRFSFFFSFKEF